MYNVYESNKKIINFSDKRKKRIKIVRFLMLCIFIATAAISIISIKCYLSLKSNNLNTAITNDNMTIHRTFNHKYLMYDFDNFYIDDYNLIMAGNDILTNNKDNNNNIINKNDDNTSNAVYNYNDNVPLSDMVEDDYFSDAVFIGDSRTEGFIIANSLSNTTSFTVKGLMVDTAFTRPAINMNGEKLSVMSALSKTKFNKVYIMLGINELGWAYSELFIKKYGEMIDYVKELNSEAQIYVQSILPVSEEKSLRDKIYNNQKIGVFNDLLKAMCLEKQVYYVNAFEAVADENGNLPVDASPDGVHLKKEYCQKWYNYLKTHSIKK